MKSKNSLLRSVRASLKMPFNAPRDERVTAVTAQILSFGFMIMIIAFMSFGLYAHFCDGVQSDISCYIMGIIGTISYGCLLAVCKLGVAEGNSLLISFFIWSFVNLPITALIFVDDVIFDIFYDIGGDDRYFIFFTYIGASVLTLAGSTVVLYKIADRLYRNNNGEMDEDEKPKNV